VLFRPQAEDELLDVQRWYESRAAGLGSRFARAADQLIERVLANPLAFPRVHDETRRAVMSRFPYAIYFRLEAEDVIVLAVHGRQHPSRWQTRT
jgi:plasmid stabilization system protein ParE